MVVDPIVGTTVNVVAIVFVIVVVVDVITGIVEVNFVCMTKLESL